MTQEDLAAHMGISRQAVSRWESGTVVPDAMHVLCLSELFGVSMETLLRDDACIGEEEIKLHTVAIDKHMDGFVIMVTLEVIILLLEVICGFILQNTFLTVLCFVPFVAVVGGFAYGYRCRVRDITQVGMLRQRCYIVSAWLGLYFPVRVVFCAAATLYPRPYYSLVLEAVILLGYLALSTLITVLLKKNPES